MSAAELFNGAAGMTSTDERLKTVPPKQEKQHLYYSNVWCSAEVPLIPKGQMEPLHGAFKTGGAKQSLRFAPLCGQCLGCQQKSSCAGQGSSDKVNLLII